jgi:hypothetical protein
MVEDSFGLLYAVPSFAEGVGRLLDFGCTTDIYNTSKTPEDADFNALRSDWRALACDMGIAFDEIREQKSSQSSDSE